MPRAQRDPDTEIPQPGLRCWFCSGFLDVEDVLREGILRARAEEDGGPFRLLACPACQRTNQCERTPLGRWFSSPAFQPRLLDFLLGRLLLPAAEDFLRAAAWFRDHEARRRFFFERDGDGRYSHRGLLWRLRAPPLEPEAERRARGEAPGRGPAAASGRAGARRGRPGGGGEEQRRVRPGPLARPWEILGVRPGASPREIRRAFQRLAVQYHPDKVHHLGEDLERLAHEKFTELTRAYETLMARERRRP